MTAIRVELELADGQFVTRMMHAGETVGRFQQNVARGSQGLQSLQAAGLSVVSSISRADESSKGFLSTLRDVSIVTGLLSLGISKLVGLQNSWVGSIVRVNAEFERLNFQMRGMARSSEPVREAANNVAWLRERAMEMPFTLKSITDGFVRLKATGIDPMSGSLTALADGITAFGGGEEQMKRTLVGISQMSGKGVVQMEEMRQQIAEHMPRAMELMARSMGVSMSQLIKDIGTGRVASKPALEAFFGELERTFGGRAKQMMETFNGQLQRTQTQLELLATSDTIRLKFFDGALKDQLRDLNDFLTSPQAQRYADQLGNAMATGVRWIRSAIDTFIEFRQEIGNVALVAAQLFGANLMFKGLSTVMSSLSGLGNALKVVSMQFGLATNAQRSFNLAVNSGAPAMRQAAAGATALTATLRGLAMGATALAPWLAGIGLAVYSAGQYFGWFGDKVESAYNRLVEFGAESRSQAKQAIDQRIAELQEAINRANEAEKGRKAGNNGFDFTDYGAQALKLQQELDQVMIRRSGLMEQAAENEDAKMLDRFKEQIERRLNAAKGSYDRELVALQEHYNALADTTRKSGGDVQKVEEQRKEAYAKRQKKLYEDQIQELRGMITWEENVYAMSMGIQQKQSQQRLDTLRNRLRSENDMLNNFNAASVPLLADAGNPKAAYEKGSKHLDRLKEDLASVRAEIGKASPELAKLQEMLRRGDFGDMGRAEVQALSEEIKVATKNLEEMEKIRDGQKDAERDLKRATDKVFEDQLDLLEKQQGRTLTEGERFVLRMENGAYKGLGPASEIAKALEGVHGRLDIAGSKSNQLGDVLRNNTFGNQSEQHIQTINDKLRQTSIILDDIGRSVGGINFGGMSLPGDAYLPGIQSGAQLGQRWGWEAHTGKTSGANLMSKNMSTYGDPRQAGWADRNITTIAASNGMKVQVHSAAAEAFKGFLDDLIGSGYNIKSVGGYNVRRKVSGGSLSEHAFGNAIDINPTQNPYGKKLITDMPKNISEMAAKWGLSWGGDWKSIKDAMHFEWRGGPTKATQEGPKADVPKYNPDLEANIADRVAATEKFRKAAEDLTKKENQVIDATQKQGRSDYLKELKEKAEEAAKGVEGTGKNLKELQDKIREGKIGSKDLEAPEYKELIAAATNLDKIEEQRAQRKRATSKVEGAEADYLRRQEELARRVKEANERMLDPMEKKSTTAYRSLRMDLESYLSDTEKAYGRETEQYRAALAMRDTMLRQHRNMEVSETAAKWAQETVETRRSLMTESQQRQLKLQEEIARIDNEVAAFRGSEEEKVRIVAAAEAQKAALRKAAAQAASPITGMMQQWGDMQTNLANATQSWMSSLADGVTNLIMGTGDLRQVIQGILKDVVNMGVKWMMSQMFGGGGSKGASGGKGMAGKAAGAATGGKTGGAGKMFPIRHSGGMVNASGIHKAVNPAVFNGAKKFHTGGIIGGPKLSRGEVPIIAKEGEGVFTPEQMSSMGGFTQNSFQISAPVTVNGSSGTPEQNQDLAKRMAKEMEGTMRGVVADEMRKQTRPGNFANSRSR